MDAAWFGVCGIAFNADEILEDKETLDSTAKLGERILGLMKQKRQPPA